MAASSSMMKFEIWMGEHYSWFDHGLVHLEDGRSFPLKGCIHVATYGADSLLLADQEHYACSDFPVRWLIHPSGIEFYCWDEEVESITLHNSSGADVMVNGYGVLPAGKSRRISHNSQA
nr:unnamed protein product [uncultured bacterium]